MRPIDQSMIMTDTLAQLEEAQRENERLRQIIAERCPQPVSEPLVTREGEQPDTGDDWSMILPTYMENWPESLRSLSIPSLDIRLTVEEAKNLGANIIEYGECFSHTGPLPDIGNIRAAVSAAVKVMPFGAFVRLGSRSPKDSWKGYESGFKILPGEDPLRFLLDASERIYEDLAIAIQHNYSPHIFVRPWLDIPHWSEFRCFMRGRRLDGISQYHYLHGEVLPEIANRYDTIRWAIEQFFLDFRKASHLDDVVFDVWVNEMMIAADNMHIWEVKLIEINPYFVLTDPCLFAWDKPFGGEFRFNRAEGREQKDAAP